MVKNTKMKRVLIIGKNSYIGNHIADWLRSRPDGEFEVEKLSVRDDTWREKDFSVYDALVHAAALVHQPEVTDEKLYHAVNTDLPYAVALKARTEGVRQFLFISTMAVYGVTKSLKGEWITGETEPRPRDLYGSSKLAAEQKLMELRNEAFRITIVRPPNVYGKSCPGRYISGFASIVRKLPAIPAAYEDARQSMLYIDNLTELIRILIERRLEGIFMPQDEHPVNAVELMEGIAHGLGINRKRSKGLGRLVRCFSGLALVTKAYGGVAYEEGLSDLGFHYRVKSFQEGIRSSVSNTGVVEHSVGG